MVGEGFCIRFVGCWQMVWLLGVGPGHHTLSVLLHGAFQVGLLYVLVVKLSDRIFEGLHLGGLVCP